MDNGEGIVFILGAAAVIVLLGVGGIGFAIGKSTVANDCDVFGAVRISNTIYDCKEKTK